MWPEPTHRPSGSREVREGVSEPYAGAYTQIDFSLPCPSIFDTAEEIREKYGIRAVRPLAPKTMERIARGLKKFVLENEEPFIVQVNNGEKAAPYVMCNNENNVGAGTEEPLPTVTTGNRNFLVAPALIQYHSETRNGEVRGQQLQEPVMTVDGSNRYALVASFLQKYYGGGYAGCGAGADGPLPTVTSVDHNSLCVATLIQMNNHCDGRDMEEPLPTITAGDGHFGEVRAFLIKYYGKGDGQDIKNPIDTVTANDRFGLVTVAGVDYRIVDIGLRMLEPKELYGCQGFPDDYIIDRDYTGRTYPRSEQVRRCGNAVCPPVAEALVRANLPELCRRDRRKNMQIGQEQTGQLRFA